MATSLTAEGRGAVREEARDFLAEHKIREPPFPVDEALAAQQLRLVETPLEEALAKMGVEEVDAANIDAMLDVGEKSVTLRQDLHRQNRKWGCVHEVAHSVLPWHRDLLYHCPIVLLPKLVQKQMELEADAFTSDCLFFGTRFLEEARACTNGIQQIIDLATDTYNASIHSALRRYVDENPDPCCLFIWRVPTNGALEQAPSLHYYISSSSFPRRRWRRTLPEDHVVAKAYQELRDVGRLVVPHEITFSDGRGSVVCSAETFFNSYALFTLAWRPRPSPK